MGPEGELCYLPEMICSEVAAGARLVPVGAQEQHGPNLITVCDAVPRPRVHLPLGSAILPLGLVAPAIMLGVSPRYLNFPETACLHRKTIAGFLLDVVESSSRYRVRKFLALDGRVGNDQSLGTVAHTPGATREGGVRLSELRLKGPERSGGSGRSRAGVWEVLMASRWLAAGPPQAAGPGGTCADIPTFTQPTGASAGYIWPMPEHLDGERRDRGPAGRERGTRAGCV